MSDLLNYRWEIGSGVYMADDGRGLILSGAEAVESSLSGVQVVVGGKVIRSQSPGPEWELDPTSVDNNTPHTGTQAIHGILP